MSNKSFIVVVDPNTERSQLLTRSFSESLVFIRVHIIRVNAFEAPQQNPPLPKDIHTDDVHANEKEGLG